MQKKEKTDGMEILTMEEYLNKRKRKRGESAEKLEEIKESRIYPLLFMN